MLLSRDALLDIEAEPFSDRVFRLLAFLSRRGINVLLTAPEPDHWVPTRGSVDDALDSQGKLQNRVHEAGGEIEGVYYVPRSLFTQDRNREGALRDILQRYGLTPEQSMLVSASVPFLKAASRLGIQTHEITASGQEKSNLLSKLEQLSQDLF